MYLYIYILIGWLFYFFGISTLFGSFNTKFQTIQFSVSIILVYKQLNVKTILFQTIQFSISWVLFDT